MFRISLPTFIAAAISIPRRSLRIRYLRTCNPGPPTAARFLGKEPPHTTAHLQFIRNPIGASPRFTARRDFHSLDPTSFSRHRRHLSQATGSFLRGWKIADRGGRFLRVIRYHDAVWQFPCAPSHNPISAGQWDCTDLNLRIEFLPRLYSPSLQCTSCCVQRSQYRNRKKPHCLELTVENLLALLRVQDPRK